MLQFLPPDPLLIIFLEYAVNGSAIPDADFDIGESYAGLMPIDSAAGNDSSLYFWFFPSENPEACDEILIWLNGGVRNSSVTNLIRLTNLHLDSPAVLPSRVFSKKMVHSSGNTEPTSPSQILILGLTSQMSSGSSNR